MIKYKLGRFREAKIEEVEVLRETAHFVFVRNSRGREVRESKRSDWGNYYDTWDEAHAALECAAEDRLMRARRNLELANSFVGNVKGMRKPEVAA